MDMTKPTNGYGLTINPPAPDGATLNFAGSPPMAPVGGDMPTTTLMLAYQIDSDPPVTVSIQAGASTWSENLSGETDCPTPGAQYTLTVNAWDETTGYTAQRLFVRGN
jgi:hypothetical protein